MIKDNLNIMIFQEINNNEEEIEVLYNSKYGHWKISNKASELYALRRIKDSNYYLRKRSDPILIQIYKELGDEFDDKKYSNTKIEKIPKKFECYYFISEYDGLETVEIDFTKYELDNLKKNIKEILENNSIDNDEKINKLKKMII
jgi:TRAP-type mannitol/chloroaromatic compound transport system substrate-binding protein